MYCKNCGSYVPDGASLCPNCGYLTYNQNSDVQYNNPQPKKGLNTKVIIAIIASVAAIIIAIIIAIVIMNSNKGGTSQSALLSMLEKKTEKNMVAFYYDDYDKNNSYEAYALVGDTSDAENSFTHVDVWFVNDTDTQLIAEDISGHTNGMLNTDYGKYISIESVKENDGASSENAVSTSIIYGVKDSQPFEPECSGQYSDVCEHDGVITGTNPETDEPISFTISTDGVLIPNLPEKSSASVSETTSVKPVTTTAATTKTKSDTNDIVTAQKNLLKSILNNPGKYYTELEGFSVNDNLFAIADVNEDGVDEVIVSFEGTCVAGMYSGVFGYNSTSKAYEKLYKIGVRCDFYRGGYIKQTDSHNHSHGETIIPYTILKMTKGDPTFVRSLSCTDESWCNEYYPFPKADDKDNDGVIYYHYGNSGFDESNPMTKSEYLAYINQYIPESKHINVNYRNLTTSNINTLK